MIVANKIARCRTQHDAVKIGYLGLYGAFNHGFIAGAFGALLSVKVTHRVIPGEGLGGSLVVLGVELCPLVPVQMIPDGDKRVRFKG